MLSGTHLNSNIKGTLYNRAIAYKSAYYMIKLMQILLHLAWLLQTRISLR